MKTRQAGAIGIAVVTLSVVGGLYWAREHTPQKPPPKGVSEAEFSDVKVELSRLRNQVALSNALATTRPDLPSSAVTEPAPQPAAAAFDENNHPAGARPLPQQPSAQEIQETRLEIFKNEQIDRTWQHEAEVTAQREVMNGLPAGAQAGALECRSSMCRVEIAYKDMESYKEFLKKSIGNPEREWKGGVMGGIIERHDDGSVRAEHYYVRPGADPMAAVLAQYQAEHE